MNAILKQTDRCVMCGMCLPHCPTYIKTRNEADSPRGRISLMQSLNTGQLAPDDPRLRAHLDGCLGCRACEAVCPSAVPYGQLIDAARDSLRGPATKTGFWSRAFLTRRPLRRLITTLLRLYQASGLRWLAQRSALLRGIKQARADTFLPPRPAFFKQAKTATTPRGKGPQVALFTGCVAEMFDAQTLTASQDLLSRLGCTVHIPTQQVCCGALYQHDGRSTAAHSLAQQNLNAFASDTYEAIISSASGCGAQLAEYAQQLNQPAAQAFSRKVKDISHYLAESGLLAQAQFEPLAQRVALHTPCSLQHVLKSDAHPLALLEKIPQIELLPLADNARCCGAAGRYMLEQPAMADALLQDKLEALAALDAQILVTSNIGCALHWQRALRRAGLTIEVLHPVTLLARQLR